MRRMRDFRQRMLVLGAGILLAALVGFYYWHATGLAIATILATLLAAYQIYQGFLPSAPRVDEAAQRLGALVEDNWGTWRGQLLGQVDPADVTFVQDDELRLGQASSASAARHLTDIHSHYEGLVPARLVILGSAGS